MRQNGKNALDLLPNESIIVTDPAFIKKSPRSGWKPGHLSLTNKRLMLRQPARDIFEMFLETISSVSTEKKGFILRSVDALCVTFVNPPKSDSARWKSRPSHVPSRFKRPSKVWIVVKEPEKWQKEIFYRTKLQVSEDDIEKIAGELGPESQSILFHIWEARHATIQELAKLYDAPNHMEVLHRIRNIINPVSEKTVGFPLLVFERSRIDPETGEKLPFSWWIIGDREAKKESIEPLMDLFDEEDHIVFVMELRGMQEEDIQMKISGDRLKLWCDSPVVSYSEEILLPSIVDPRTAEKRYHNGILEVRLQKSLASPVLPQLRHNSVTSS
ncbi:Hsp20/alpha crystallin family protein [Acidobacteria bacterium AH-259-A15]|nr:Hsp20/alpha crystallin family protein [Acidobacteria bacterium AH-259-A15]